MDRLASDPETEEMFDRLAVSENIPEEFMERSLTDDSFYDGVDPSRFLKLNRLGEGQYATVYRAKSLTENDKIVAIKYLRLLSGAESLQLTGKKDLHEVEILSKLNHPNVIRFLDYFSQGGQKAVVLEFMDFSLDGLLKGVVRYPVPLPQTLCMLVQMVRGLAYLHEQNVIHRDLKPNNVLVNKVGEVKIGDFGCSRRTEGDARYSTQFACRAYRAPEIILSTKVYNQTVDIWALGCIVAEFYKKGPLFTGTCDIEQIFTISRTIGSPRPDDYRADQISGLQLNFHQYPKKALSDTLPHLPPFIGILIENCLVYDIDQRWTSQKCLTFLSHEEKTQSVCSASDLLAPFLPAGRRQSQKRKSKFSPDTSNSDLLDLSPAHSEDGDGSCQLSPKLRAPLGPPPLTSSLGARKKLCF